ncbi:hypothetical protein [Citrobacter tructae]|uniref:hypothetical protein n=1 Tax=Citrobacter tructae TaxID=2562449 RepID=UPI003F5587D9
MNIEPGIFSQLVEQQKRLGLPSFVAARRVLDFLTLNQGRRELGAADLKAFVQAAANHFRDLSLLDYAKLLRPYSKSVGELAEAICEMAADAAELVAVLLDGEVYPLASKDEIREALGRCGYSSRDVDMAIRLNFAVTFVVQANRPWQDTGITLEANEKAVIQYLSGWWFISPQLPRCDGNGGPRRISYPDYALPGYPEGGLVGRVNNQAFWVGNQCETPAGLTGKLALCPNDDLPGSYGVGLADNIGSLTVKISVKRR